MNHFERRKRRPQLFRKIIEEVSKKISVNRRKGHINSEPMEEPVKRVFKPSHGQDFLTEGLE